MLSTEGLLQRFIQIAPILLELIQNSEEDGTLGMSLYKVRINFVANSDKDTLGYRN